MFPLPLSFVVLCFLALDLVTAQQCHLKTSPPTALGSPGNPGGASPSKSSSNIISTPTSSGGAAGASPQPTTFAYGTQPVRGVNLCVEFDAIYVCIN